MANDNGEAPTVVGICMEIAPESSQECGGVIIQDIVEKRRGKILGFFLGHTDLVWKCKKCKKEYPLIDPFDTIHSLSR